MLEYYSHTSFFSEDSITGSIVPALQSNTVMTAQSTSAESASSKPAIVGVTTRNQHCIFVVQNKLSEQCKGDYFCKIRFKKMQKACV